MEKINEFLQSDEWRKFQETVGRRTFCISNDNFYASIIEHKLPIAGRYFYIPRGPIIKNPKSEILNPKQIQNSKSEIQNFLDKIISLAKKENAGWIRVEPASEEILEIISAGISEVKPRLRSRGFTSTIKRAPHDMQPKEVFIIDIAKPEEQLLAEMKAKTRYNIKIAQKHNVKIIITHSLQPDSRKYLEKFLELVKITAKRDGITLHPENYYRKMFKIIPAENLKLYVAEYENKIIAANIIIYCGNTATYLHGASDNEFRNVMAPYLLQWQAILDAKKAGLERYDFGGISTNYELNTNIRITNKWRGITRFKLGFSPETKPVEFPGSYDIVINPAKYNLYRIIQKIKSFLWLIKY